MRQDDTKSNIPWNEFPQAQSFIVKHMVHGRVVSLFNDDLTLNSQGQNSTWSLQKCEFKRENLKVGDIIELHHDGSSSAITLKILVSSQSPSPFKDQTASFQNLYKWQEFIGSVRSFFIQNKFLEIRTPSLVPSPGLEPFLDPFETKFKMGQSEINYFLPTSPEFHLKKALTLGFEKCFELKDCFRNGELSPHHQPEFLMLEWYRAYSGTSDMMDDVKALLIHTAKLAKVELNKVTVLTMEELWSKKLNFNLTPKSTASELLKLCETLNLDVSSKDDFDDLFTRIFIECLEPELKKYSEPVILWHYPPSQAALARFTSEGWADRFEVYWKGLELANAFCELNDPEEQKKRFKKDQEKKKQLGKKVVPVDEEFIKALEWGMPPSVGIALGVERLFMALYELDSIEEVRLFPMKEL